MRQIQYLIDHVRRVTENTTFSADTGISDEEVLQYFNDGQDEIQAVVFTLFPDIFQREKEINVTRDQEVYAIPDDAFLGNRVQLVEYSSDGQSRNYRPLFQGGKRERLSGVSSEPSFYIRRSGSILLQPAPDNSTGKIRLTYQRRVPRLDKRRATVSAAVLNSGNNTITSLTLDTSTAIDDTGLLEDNYITIIDKNGAINMKKIPISAINTTSGAVTVEAGFTYEDGESISANNYVLRGKESSTHSELPDICEKYLLEYVALRLSMRDSSTDAATISALLAKIEETIRRAFSEPDGDVSLVPILDAQYFYDGD